MRKENATLLKKLTRYSAMVGPALITAGSADAQIVYSDVDPDFELVASGDAVAIDMDGDGVSDFVAAIFISTSGAGGPLNFAGAAPYSANGNGILGYSSSPFYYPSALDAGATIDDTGNFWSYFGYLGTMIWYYIDGSGTYGQWDDVTDKYMGVRFISGAGTTHYGWIRMDVHKNPTHLVLKDLAYESTPDAGIDAGATVTGVPSTVSQLTGINVFAFEKNVFITSNEVAGDLMNIQVTDMTGKTVMDLSTKQSTTRLSLNEVASGLYLITVEKGGQVKTKKVSIR